MALVSEAMTVLSNPETRAFHDQYHVKPPEKMMRTAKETQASTNRP